MKYIDNFLNSITMYRLVLYGLTLLSVLGIIMSFAGVLPFNGLNMLGSLILILFVCAVSNKIFATLFRIPSNIESSFITAYILFLILPAPATVAGIAGIAFASLIAMSAKYVFTIQGKHIFNPAAFGAVILAISGLGAATWWVGSSVLLLPVVIIGLLMVRKVRWSWLFLSFIIVSAVSIFTTAFLQGLDLDEVLLASVFSGPLIFFGAVMLTEPATAPPTRSKQIIYGALVGALYAIPFHFGPFYNAPELSLLIGNMFSFIVSPKGRPLLQFKEKIQLAPLIYDFVFKSDKKVKFAAGQYMEWTIDEKHGDSRGNRRFFTIASSPTEEDLRIGVKIPEQSSSFKKALKELQQGDNILAGHLAGDFTIENSGSTKSIVGIAGGIGVTPFRSIIKELTDKNLKSDMVLFYACSDPSEFVYQDIFKQAENIGIKTVYVLSGAKEVPKNWTGKTGYITEDIIKAEVSGYQNREYYISGPNVMVDAYKKLLLSMNIARKNIHTDYFPGY